MRLNGWLPSFYQVETVTKAVQQKGMVIKMKILFAASRMGIGGAETHIAGLASELTRRGHKIWIASAGGVLSDSLGEGIEHIILPLDGKTPLAAAEALYGLAKLIKRENFDVVHAHARIPAFLCGILRRFLHFRLVTTAHLDFKPGIFGRITVWGEKTLAVSQDIKDYLISCYRVFPDNISVTVNGIDTDYFSPFDSGKEDLLHIIHVSRFDRDRSLTAFLLTEAMEELKRCFPTLRLTLVGDGNDTKRLFELADEVNEKLGEGTVTLCGSQSDILPYLKKGNIFVGVSRAALEAMSCGLPTILSGNQGYLGIYTKEMKKRAAATNFCCRGERMPDVLTLKSDLESLIIMGKEKRKKLGEEGRETVLDGYTLGKTADDYLSVYSSLPAVSGKKGGYLICGYFGYGNLGDEAVLEAEISAIRKMHPLAPITVMSHTKKATSDSYGVSSVNRYSLFGIVRSMKKHDELIFGGGGLLQDATSVRSVLYYCAVLMLAAVFGMKITVLANGIGPLHHKISKMLVKKAVSNADMISVRDRHSSEILKQIGISNKIFTVSDPASELIPADDGRVKYLLEKLGITGKYYVLSLRPSGENDNEFVSSVASACIKISSDYGLKTVIVMMNPIADRKICRCASKLIPGSAVMEGLSAREAAGIIAGAEFTAGTRLHALVFSKAAGKPFFAFAYDPKVKSFAEENGGMGCCEIDGSAGKRLAEAIDKEKNICLLKKKADT